MQKYHSYFAQARDRFVSEWADLLRFKSISSDSAYRGDCAACARWLCDHLQRIGFETHLWSSDTLPLVFGSLPGNPNKPTVLIYGHYDVQPPEPLDLWRSGPFEPIVRDGRMYARGAQDNKGQLFAIIKALEALKAGDADLPTIKLLIEGEEESGSGALTRGIPSWSSSLKADILVVADTLQVAPNTPTITMGLRGIAKCEVEVHGPAHDLHSGLYGGVVLNPLQALSKILAALHNEDGSIAVPGFYDGITLPSVEDRAQAQAAPINYEKMAADLGVPLCGGERHLAPIERRGFRPTLEINGIGGGHQGPGGKTVIPAKAFAKLSIRLAAGQCPQETLQRVTTFIEAAAPEGVRVSVTGASVGGAAFQLSTASAVVQKAREAIRNGFGKDAVLLWEGASVPIIPLLAEAAGAEPLLVGFGLEEDLIHSPNESFSLEQFEQVFRYTVSLLHVV
jgi:acetylornithine deacetylase/succinyl-diaminopimelate desuccinylase-like protein